MLKGGSYPNRSLDASLAQSKSGLFKYKATEVSVGMLAYVRLRVGAYWASDADWPRSAMPPDLRRLAHDSPFLSGVGASGNPGRFIYTNKNGQL